MTEALGALQWAVAAALLALGVLAFVEWVRHRDRSRGYLALAVDLLGVLGLIGRITTQTGETAVVIAVISIVLFMASAFAFALFRHTLIPLRAAWLRLYIAATVGVTAATVALNLSPSATTPRGLPLAVDVLLLLTWCVIVGASIVRLWTVSGTLPRVQRARLRALNGAFGGIILALIGTVFTAFVSSNTVAQVAIEIVVLLSTPLLAVALSPPRWLRRTWREGEEVQLRLAMNNLLLFSPDVQTLSNRALEWAARLLGGGAALIALDHRLVAVRGIGWADATRLVHELEGTQLAESWSHNSSLGLVAAVPLRSQAGQGMLAVLAGRFTPLFGEEELDRLSQYAVSITVALDRVHLYAGVQRNAELLDLAYDAVFTWDFATRAIQFWNKGATEVYGFTAEEAVGKDPQVLLRTQYPVPLDEIIAALREDEHWEGELTQHTKDGRILPISARWAVQRDANGRPISVLEINRDITEQRRAGEELRAARDLAEQASNAKSEYLSRMSHELRTPLAAMLGFSDLLEMREPREDQVQAIDAIQRAGSHLLSLVNDVLDIARIEAGRESLSVRPLDVRVLLEESVALVTQSASQRGVTISVHVDALERIFVRADRQRLMQVLLNLLSNAIKYGAEGGHVVARAEVRGDAVQIDVSDDGPGLDQAQQARLFQPFERLGAERSAVQGTGLGLALARQLTMAMGGTMWVTSEPGHGATFSVRLDLADEADAEKVVRARGPAVLRDHTADKVVLYVEDNLSTITLVESIFALRPGTRLITAMQGGIALELAREHQPDLILLDLHLPDMDGDEVILHLRRDPRTSSIPVVMHSADATDRQVQRMLAAGAAAFLAKPARVPDFLATIDRVLGDPVSTATESA